MAAPLNSERPGSASAAGQNDLHNCLLRKYSRLHRPMTLQAYPVQNLCSNKVLMKGMQTMLKAPPTRLNLTAALVIRYMSGGPQLQHKITNTGIALDTNVDRSSWCCGVFCMAANGRLLDVLCILLPLPYKLLHLHTLSCFSKLVSVQTSHINASSCMAPMPEASEMILWQSGPCVAPLPERTHRQ